MGSKQKIMNRAFYLCTNITDRESWTAEMGLSTSDETKIE